MTLPYKALRIGQLRFKSTGNEVPSSGHKVEKVEFTDRNGETKIGYYKPCSDDYPTLLAKYAVAISVWTRMALGKRAAEDRLVLDENDQIKGSISLAIPNYRPLISSIERDPEDPQEKQLVNPTAAKLIEHNVMELLIASWCRGNDDLHIGNLALIEGLIDYDMYLYAKTYIMKGGRWVAGILQDLPEKAMALKSTQLDDFPIVEGPTHAPTHALPGNINVAKQCKAYKEFRALAANPSLELDNKTISSQDQLFKGLLKELISFQPETLRARLQDYFGDLTLDYESLPLAKKEKLAKTYPKIFNEKTNKGSFVDHMMGEIQRNYDENKVGEIQRNYDELYRATVFYMGCKENKSGVSVPSFNHFLNSRPSAFAEVKRWIIEQNKILEAEWLFSCKNKKDSEKDENVFSGKGPATFYNLQEVERRYHQVWRDAHYLSLDSLLKRLVRFERKLRQDLSGGKPSRPSLYKPSPLQSSLKIDDPTFTDVKQLIDEVKRLRGSAEIDVDCDRNSSLYIGLMQLKTFIDQLQTLVGNYHSLKEDLTIESNSDFFQNFMKLIAEYSPKLYEAFGQETSASNQYAEIDKALAQYCGQMHFKKHLSSKDLSLEEKESVKESSFMLIRPHTDDEVIQSYLTAMFRWADEMEPAAFTACIAEIIEGYKPGRLNVMAQRERAEEVEGYLKSNEGKMSNANRLAYILSAGGTKSTSLNTKIITFLMHKILYHQSDSYKDINLASLRAVYERNNANINQVFNNDSKCLYARKAKEYVNKSEEFTHLHTKKNVERFNELMYAWIKKLSVKRFITILSNSLKVYNPGLLNFASNKKRSHEIKGYITSLKGRMPSGNNIIRSIESSNTNDCNVEFLALIFSKGGIENNSFNTILFSTILSEMKNDIMQKHKKELTSEDQLILAVKEKDQEILNSLQPYSKGHTFNKKPKKAPPLAIGY